MNQRQYYGERIGQQPSKISLYDLKVIYLGLFKDWQRQGLLQGTFGYHCVDDGDVPGTAGTNPAAYVLRMTRSGRVWPVGEFIASWTEAELFTAIEFFHDAVSVGSGGRFHSFGGCGNHYTDFDVAAGQNIYRDQVNPFLSLYEDGFELSERGEVLRLLDSSTMDLVAQSVPQNSDRSLATKVQRASDKFRRYAATPSDKREAVRELADALEYMRGDLKKLFLSKKDDDDLFNIINNFHIRHMNKNQRTDYDDRWIDWMFHFYMATVLVGLRFLAEQKA